MKCLLLLAALGGLLTSSLRADDARKFPSPDGRFALRLDAPSKPDEEALTSVKLVDAKSGAVLLELDSLGHPWIEEIKMVWSPDSHRAAFMSASRRGGWTTLYARLGDTFVEVPMPELIHATIQHRTGFKTVLAERVPIRWMKPNVLLLENHVEDDAGNSGKSRMLLTFDAENHVTVTKAK